MKFKYNDGGRAKYFKGKEVGDCVVRSIAIASGNDYKFVYDTAQRVIGKSPRNGVPKKMARQIAKHFGGTWVCCSGIGVKSRTHLRDSELPDGRLVCVVSKHYTAVIDHIVNDIFDPSRDGNRMVYGYFVFNNQ